MCQLFFFPFSFFSSFSLFGLFLFPRTLRKAFLCAGPRFSSGAFLAYLSDRGSPPRRSPVPGFIVPSKNRAAAKSVLGFSPPLRSLLFFLLSRGAPSPLFLGLSCVGTVLILTPTQRLWGGEPVGGGFGLVLFGNPIVTPVCLLAYNRQTQRQSERYRV